MILNKEIGTFPECEEALAFNDFGEAVNDAGVLRCCLVLCLQSDFDDFKGLHDKDL